MGKRPGLLDLPDELIMRILSKHHDFGSLDDESLALGVVCKRFQRFVLDPSLWKTLRLGWRPSPQPKTK